MAVWKVTISAPGASTGTTSYYTQTASGGLGRRVGGRHRSSRGGGGGKSWKRAPPKKFMAPKVTTWEQTPAGRSYVQKKADEMKSADKALAEMKQQWGLDTTPQQSKDYYKLAYQKLYGARDKVIAQKAAAQALKEQVALSDAWSRASKPTTTTRAPTTFGQWPSKAAYLEWRAGQLTSARANLASMRKAAESLRLEPKFTRRQLGRGRGSIPARLRLPRARQARAVLKRARQREMSRVKQAETAVNLWETQSQV